jgi:hypothetical protein
LVVIAVAAIGLAACDKPTPVSVASSAVVVRIPTSAPSPGHAPETPGESAVEDRCVVLPPLPRAANPNFPSPMNSDHTPKRLPPGPPGEPGQTVLFHYDDFGPQAMAGELLGSAWWSWEAGGSFEPGDAFDVRVVVHRPQPPDTLASAYPTIAGKSDYRFVNRTQALAFLEARLGELASIDADDPFDWRPLQQRLRQTQQIIQQCLPD